LPDLVLQLARVRRDEDLVARCERPHDGRVQVRVGLAGAGRRLDQRELVIGERLPDQRRHLGLRGPILVAGAELLRHRPASREDASDAFSGGVGGHSQLRRCHLRRGAIPGCRRSRGCGSGHITQDKRRVESVDGLAHLDRQRRQARQQAAEDRRQRGHVGFRAVRDERRQAHQIVEPPQAECGLRGEDDHRQVEGRNGAGMAVRYLPLRLE